MRTLLPKLAIVCLLELMGPASTAQACDCAAVDPAIDAAIAAKTWNEAERLVAAALARSDTRQAHLCRAHVLLGKAAREVVSLDLPSIGLPSDWTGTVGVTSDQVGRLVQSRAELDPALAAAALAELESVIARWPTDPHAHRCTLEVAQSRRDHEAFLRALRRAADQLKPLGLEAAVDELLPYPLRYFEEKESRKAADAYRALLEVYPESGKLQSSYGVVLISQGQLDPAIERFGLAFALIPHDTLVLGNSANAALYKRDFTAARRFYELLLQESPDATSRYFDLATIALQRGGAAALPAWNRYLERHAIVPDDERWAQLGSDILSRLDHLPTSRDLDEIARVLIESGAPAQAIPVLVGASDREPGNPIHPFLLAHAYDRGGFPVLALEELERTQKLLAADALLETPSRGSVAYELGRVALVAERFELAVSSLEVAAREQPEEGDTQYTLGLAYQRLGRDDLAHLAFQRCLTAEHASGHREFCRKFAGQTAPTETPADIGK